MRLLLIISCLAYTVADGLIPNAPIATVFHPSPLTLITPPVTGIPKGKFLVKALNIVKPALAITKAIAVKKALTLKAIKAKAILKQHLKAKIGATVKGVIQKKLSTPKVIIPEPKPVQFHVSKSKEQHIVPHIVQHSFAEASFSKVTSVKQPIIQNSGFSEQFTFGAKEYKPPVKTYAPAIYPPAILPKVPVAPPLQPLPELPVPEEIYSEPIKEKEFPAKEYGIPAKEYGPPILPVIHEAPPLLKLPELPTPKKVYSKPAMDYGPPEIKIISEPTKEYGPPIVPVVPKAPVLLPLPELPIPVKPYPKPHDEYGIPVGYSSPVHSELSPLPLPFPKPILNSYGVPIKPDSELSTPLTQSNFKSPLDSPIEKSFVKSPIDSLPSNVALPKFPGTSSLPHLPALPILPSAITTLDALPKVDKPHHALPHISNVPEIIPDLPKDIPHITSDESVIPVDFSEPLNTEPITLPVNTQVHIVDDKNQYTNGFSLPDGTKVSEQGKLISTNGGWEYVLAKRGQYEYISPEGKPINVKWIADENGFRLEK